MEKNRKRVLLKVLEFIFTLLIVLSIYYGILLSAVSDSDNSFSEFIQSGVGRFVSFVVVDIIVSVVYELVKLLIKRNRKKS